MAFRPLSEFIQLNPQFQDVNPQDSLQAYHQLTGTDLPIDQFAQEVGYDATIQEYEAPHIGVLAEGVRSIKRGGLGLVQTIPEIAHFVGRNTGWQGLEDLSDDAIDHLEEMQRSPELAASYEAQTGDNKSLRKWISTVGESAPSLAATFIGGGVGATLGVLGKASKLGVAANLMKTMNFTKGAMVAGSAQLAGEQTAKIRAFEKMHPGEDVSAINEVTQTALYALVGGALEAFYPAKVISKIAGKKAAAKIGKELAQGAVNEGTTEGLQTLISNTLAKYGMDPDQEITEGLLEAVVAGGILGSTVSGSIEGLRSIGAPKETDGAPPAKPTDKLDAAVQPQNLPSEPGTPANDDPLSEVNDLPSETDSQPEEEVFGPQMTDEEAEAMAAQFEDITNAFIDEEQIGEQVEETAPLDQETEEAGPAPEAPAEVAQEPEQEPEAPAEPITAKKNATHSVYDGQGNPREIVGRLYSTEVLPGEQLITYKADNGVWQVIDAITGASMGDGPTRIKAISEFKKNVDHLGVDKTKQLLLDYRKKLDPEILFTNPAAATFQRKRPSTVEPIDAPQSARQATAILRKADELRDMPLRDIPHKFPEGTSPKEKRAWVTNRITELEDKAAALSLQVPGVNKRNSALDAAFETFSKYVETPDVTDTEKAIILLTQGKLLNEHRKQLLSKVVNNENVEEVVQELTSRPIAPEAANSGLKFLRDNFPKLVEPLVNEGVTVAKELDAEGLTGAPIAKPKNPPLKGRTHWETQQAEGRVAKVFGHADVQTDMGTDFKSRDVWLDGEYRVDSLGNVIYTKVWEDPDTGQWIFAQGVDQDKPEKWETFTVEDALVDIKEWMNVPAWQKKGDHRDRWLARLEEKLEASPETFNNMVFAEAYRTIPKFPKELLPKWLFDLAEAGKPMPKQSTLLRQSAVLTQNAATKQRTQSRVGDKKNRNKGKLKDTNIIPTLLNGWFRNWEKGEFPDNVVEGTFFEDTGKVRDYTGQADSVLVEDEETHTAKAQEAGVETEVPEFTETQSEELNTERERLDKFLHGDSFVDDTKDILAPGIRDIDKFLTSKLVAYLRPIALLRAKKLYSLYTPDELATIHAKIPDSVFKQRLIDTTLHEKGSLTAIIRQYNKTHTDHTLKAPASKEKLPAFITYMPPNYITSLPKVTRDDHPSFQYLDTDERLGRAETIEFITSNKYDDNERIYKVKAQILDYINTALDRAQNIVTTNPDMKAPAWEEKIDSVYENAAAQLEKIKTKGKTVKEKKAYEKNILSRADAIRKEGKRIKDIRDPEYKEIYYTAALEYITDVYTEASLDSEIEKKLTAAQSLINKQLQGTSGIDTLNQYLQDRLAGREIRTLEEMTSNAMDDAAAGAKRRFSNLEKRLAQQKKQKLPAEAIAKTQQDVDAFIEEKRKDPFGRRLTSRAEKVQAAQLRIEDRLWEGAEDLVALGYVQEGGIQKSKQKGVTHFMKFVHPTTAATARVGIKYDEKNNKVTLVQPAQLKPEERKHAQVIKTFSAGTFGERIKKLENFIRRIKPGAATDPKLKERLTKASTMLQFLRQQRESYWRDKYETRMQKYSYLKNNLVNLKRRVKLKGADITKDMLKFAPINRLIAAAKRKSTSPTAAYKFAAREKANVHYYTKSDVVGISAEKAGRTRTPFNKDEVAKAINARATIITDTWADRKSPDNIGEREVAEFLRAKGYVEEGASFIDRKDTTKKDTRPDVERFIQGTGIWRPESAKQETTGEVLFAPTVTLQEAIHAPPDAAIEQFGEEIIQQFDEFSKTNAAVFTDIDNQVAAGTNAAALIDTWNEASYAQSHFTRLIDVLNKVAKGVVGEALQKVNVQVLDSGRSHYDPASNTIYLHPSQTTDLYTLTHEVMHALSSKFITSNKTHIFTKRLNALFEEFKKAADNDPIAGHYGFTNVNEFLAEVYANPRLRSWLNEQKSGNKTLWEKISAWMQGVLGIKGTPLDDILNVSNAIIEEQAHLEAEATGPTATSDQIGEATAKFLELPQYQRLAYVEHLSKKTDPELRALGTRLKALSEQKRVLDASSLDNVNVGQEMRRVVHKRKGGRYETLSKLKKKFIDAQSWTLSLTHLNNMVSQFSKPGKALLDKYFIDPMNDSQNSFLKAHTKRRDSALNALQEETGLTLEKIRMKQVSWGNKSKVPIDNVMYLWAGMQSTNKKQREIMAKAIGKNFGFKTTKKLKGTKEYVVDMGAIDSIFDKFSAEHGTEWFKAAAILQENMANRFDEIAEALRKVGKFITSNINEQTTPEHQQEIQDAIREMVGDKWEFFTQIHGYVPMLGKQGLQLFTPAQGAVMNYERLAADIHEANIRRSGFAGLSYISERGDTGRAAENLKLDMLEVWEKSIDRQEHFIAYAKPVADMREILFNSPIDPKTGKSQNDSLHTTLTKQWGPDMAGAYKSYVDAVANPKGYKQSYDTIDSHFQWVKRKAALAFLGWNFVTMAKQLPSVIYYARYVPLPILAKHALKMAAGNPFANLKEQSGWVQEHSPQMKDRYIDEVMDDLDDNPGNVPQWLSRIIQSKFKVSDAKAQKEVSRVLMSGIRYIDKMATTIGYSAVYDYEYNKPIPPGVSDAQHEAAAHNAALRATLTTQPASHVKDISRLYRTSEKMNIMLMFTNQLNKIWGLGSNDVVYRRIIEGKMTQESIVTAISLATGALAIGFMSAGWKFEDDDETTGIFKEQIDRLVAGVFSSIPFLGQAFAAAYNGYQSPGNVLLESAFSAVKAVNYAAQGDLGAAGKAATRTYLMPGHVQFWRFADALIGDDYGPLPKKIFGRKKRDIDTEADIQHLLTVYQKRRSEEINTPGYAKVQARIKRLAKLKRREVNEQKYAKLDAEHKELIRLYHAPNMLGFIKRQAQKVGIVPSRLNTLIRESARRT